MAFLNFGKKKVEVKDVKKVEAKCACGNTCSIEEQEGAKIIVLGACCKKSSQSFENVQLATKELGIEETVVNIGDMATIAKYGVMQTPALVVNSKVLCQGKLISVENAKELISKEF